MYTSRLPKLKPIQLQALPLGTFFYAFNRGRLSIHIQKKGMNFFDFIQCRDALGIMRMIEPKRLVIACRQESNEFVNCVSSSLKVEV